ncbi:MAG TPA: carboxypeptidase regulatory-like domain-containing protein [Longimicrobiales bacterium]|nr:carboxypeptidase regulatory-like domain-containing protein [Longimicrobiales bacterium]
MALAAAPAPGSGQQFAPVPIRGRVADAVTAQPVPGAVVRHLTSPAVTVTDSAGAFLLMLPPDGRYPLRVEQLGYETSLLVLPSTAPIEFSELSLTAAPLELKGIEVTVDRFAQRRRQASRTVRVVGAERLAQAYGDTYQVVARLVTGARPCPLDSRQICRQAPGGLKPVAVCADDRTSYDVPADLERLQPADLYLVEVYEGFDRSSDVSVRVYTRAFVAGLAGGQRLLRPWRWGCAA